MKKYIDKSALVAEIEKRIEEGEKVAKELPSSAIMGLIQAYKNTLSFLNTLEVKEVDIASMADDYYDALIKEAEMGVDMAGNCRLAYYNGCKDVLNKIRKGD